MKLSPIEKKLLAKHNMVENLAVIEHEFWSAPNSIPYTDLTEKQKQVYRDHMHKIVDFINPPND